MTDQEWTDRIVGDRMAVDREFRERVTASQFSRQQWGLIMTAVRFEIEHPEDPDRARIVADTSRFEDVLPELDRVAEMERASEPSDDSGVLGTVRDALGLGTNGSRESDRERRESAEGLVAEYAADLQAHLEERGKWEEVREEVVD